MGLSRIIAVMFKTRTKYSGSIECIKPADETLDFIRKYLTNFKLFDTKHCRGLLSFCFNDFIVKEDTKMGDRHTIKKVLANSKNKPIETMEFKIWTVKNVAVQIDLKLDCVFAEDTFKEFKKDLDEKVPSLSIERPVIEKPEPVDLSKKSLKECLNFFESSLDTFEQDPNEGTFENVKNAKAEITKKFNKQEPTIKAQFTQAFSQIDLFLNTIITQLNNPAMANNIGMFASTYIGQIKGQLAPLMLLELK